jgi:hypothetical protein
MIRIQGPFWRKQRPDSAHPEQKDIVNRSPMYKSYWAQWKSLTVRNGILECHCESVDGRSKIAQIVLPCSRVNDVLF